MTSIDLIVVNYRTYDLIDSFLRSWRAFKPQTSSRVILVDNDTSGRDLYKLDTKDIEVYPFRENLGYAGGCNFGASLGDSDYVGFFNSDTRFVDAECVDRCVRYLEDNPDVAVVGPLQYSTDGRVTHGGIFGTQAKPRPRGFKSLYPSQFTDVQDAVAVSGSAFFMRRSIWDEMQLCPIYRESFPKAMGAFPPFPHFYEETLYCYHVFAHGYRCVYLGEAEMIHEWHKSSPVGSQSQNAKVGREMFNKFCDDHSIPHGES